MSEPTCSPSRDRPGTPGFVQILWAGVGVALIGCAVLALVESLARAAAVQGSCDEPLPWGLIAASVGRGAWSYALLWCPIMAVSAALYAWARKRASHPTPVPFLLGLFTALAGLTLVVVHFRIAATRSLVLLAAASAAVMVVAAGFCVAARVVRSKLAPGRYRRVVDVLTVVVVVFYIGFGVAFYYSPLFDPGSYRVPPAKPVTSGAEHPHVLWVVLDTARADRMSCYGYSKRTTPFLDEWAEKSIVLDRAVADGNWTLPAHASMFTGMSTRQHGAVYGHLWLDDKFTTVADRLGQEGYATALFSNNPFVSDATNLAKGFQSVWPVCHLGRFNVFSLAALHRRACITPFLPWLDFDHGAGLTNHLVGRWLDEHGSGGQPLFLFVNYVEAHLPYAVPRRYRRMYMTGPQVHRSYDLRSRVYGDINRALGVRHNTEGPGFLTPDDRDIVRSQYDASVRYLDDRLKELIGMFKQRGLLRNTLVVITSDHGEYLGTHGMWAHAAQVYDDVAHVAMLVHEPGRTRGLRITTPVQLSDLAETVIGAALGRGPSAWGPNSRDLLELAAETEEKRVVFVQCREADPEIRDLLRRSADPSLRHRAQGQVAAVDGRFKYIESNDGRRELYDLVHDPGELENVIETHPDEAERLATRLSAWREKVPLYRRDEGEQAPALDAATIDALQALGYVGGRE